MSIRQVIKRCKHAHTETPHTHTRTTHKHTHTRKQHMHTRTYHAHMHTPHHIRTRVHTHVQEQTHQRELSYPNTNYTIEATNLGFNFLTILGARKLP